VVIFRLGTEWLALPTGMFQEVGEQCTIRTLPQGRGGTLSGLAISKRLAQFMGGRIWMESEAVKCSTFHFTIQMKPFADESPARWVGIHPNLVGRFSPTGWRNLVCGPQR
jgi:hypothetical protein